VANQPFERQAALFDRVHPEYGKGCARGGGAKPWRRQTGRGRVIRRFAR
jgi:hypothetical protein